MKSIHLIIPDLFLPKDIATEAGRGLHLPVLEKMLGRGASTGSDPLTKPSVLGAVEGSGRTGEGGCLENFLCESFGVSCHPDVPIAPISAAFDGLAEGCWMRSDPVHLYLQRDQLLMAGVQVSGAEAAALSASLNAHFAGQGMEFFAPHPQRWYVRLNELPRMSTTPLSQVVGGDVRRVLPAGEDASNWHRVFNEIQMLLFAHPLNEAREARGEMPINSVWFWGGGCDLTLNMLYDRVSSDGVLAEMFASAAGIPFAAWFENWRDAEKDARQLLVWTGLSSALQRGDLTAWRDSLQDFENGYLQPLWQALSAGKIEQLQLDVLSGENARRVRLTRGDTRAFWRRAKPLAGYSMM